jgi:hypothetical protein
MVDTRAYFTAATSICLFVTNLYIKNLTNITKQILTKK